MYSEVNMRIIITENIYIFCTLRSRSALSTYIRFAISYLFNAATLKIGRLIMVD